MKPSALLTNDDGINAAFLHILVSACEHAGFRVFVAAPSGERSWIGRAFSRHREVTVADYPNLGEHAWSIDGTPSDCVNIALGHLLETHPDIVLSGINIGFNATMPLCLSSGTLAGATEGAAWGLPSAAYSLDLEESLFEQILRNPSHCPDSLQTHLASAARHAARFAQSLVAQKPDRPMLVHSLNYPSTVTDSTHLERTTPALVRHGCLFRPSALGYRFAWNDGETIRNESHSDISALGRGHISHTIYDFGAAAFL